MECKEVWSTLATDINPAKNQTLYSCQILFQLTFGAGRSEVSYLHILSFILLNEIKGSKHIFPLLEEKQFFRAPTAKMPCVLGQTPEIK